MSLNKQIRQFRKKVMERDGEADVAVGTCSDGSYFTIDYTFPPNCPAISDIGIELEARYSLSGYGNTDNRKRWFTDKGKNLGCSPWGYFDVVSRPTQLGITTLFFYPPEEKDNVSEPLLRGHKRKGYELFEIGFEPRRIVTLHKGDSHEPIRHDIKSLSEFFRNKGYDFSHQKLDKLVDKYQEYIRQIREGSNPNLVIDLAFKIYDEFK